MSLIHHIHWLHAWPPQAPLLLSTGERSRMAHVALIQPQKLPPARFFHHAPLTQFLPHSMHQLHAWPSWPLLLILDRGSIPDGTSGTIHPGFSPCLLNFSPPHHTHLNPSHRSLIFPFHFLSFRPQMFQRSANRLSISDRPTRPFGWPVAQMVCLLVVQLNSRLYDSCAEIIQQFRMEVDICHPGWIVQVW